MDTVNDQYPITEFERLLVEEFKNNKVRAAIFVAELDGVERLWIEVGASRGPKFQRLLAMSEDPSVSVMDLLGTQKYPSRSAKPSPPTDLARLRQARNAAWMNGTPRPNSLEEIPNA